MVALRVYVRTRIVKAFGWDDGWMVFAQLMHTMNVSCAIGGAIYGTGRLMKDLTPYRMMMALRVRWNDAPLFRTSSGTTTNLLCTTVLVDMLLRLLPHHDRRQSVCRHFISPHHADN